MHDGAATCRGLQGHREPRSTSFWIAACPLGQSGHCAARGSHAHHRADQLADWPRSAVRFPIKCSNHELSYALLARARESFELCSHFKSLPPVSDRELSADLTWRARRRKPEFPALGSGTQSRCVLGERGVNTAVFCTVVESTRRGNPIRSYSDPCVVCDCRSRTVTAPHRSGVYFSSRRQPCRC